MPRPAVFLDRDGTIIEEVGYPSRPEQVRILPGAAEALARLKEAGYALVVVTNQSGIARGLMNEDQLNHIHETLDDRFAARGADIEAFYACPHHPDPLVAKRRDLAVECECRKPKPGMVLQAAEDLDLDLAASWLVGDGWRDVQAGQAAGVRTIKLPAPPTQETPRPREVDPPTAEVDDLAAAADVILGTEGAPPEEGPVDQQATRDAPPAKPAENRPRIEVASEAPQPHEPPPRPERPVIIEETPVPPPPAPPPQGAPVGRKPATSVPPAVPPPEQRLEPTAAAPAEEVAEGPEEAGARSGVPPTSRSPLEESAEATQPAAAAEEAPGPAGEPAEVPPEARPAPTLLGETCARCGRDIPRADLKAGRAVVRDGFLLCPDCLTTQPPETAGEPTGTEGLLRAILLELRRAGRRAEPEGLMLTRLFAYILQLAALTSALFAALLPGGRDTLLLVAVFVQLLVVALLLMERKP